MEQITLALPTLSALTGNKIDARFDGGRLSSDGGAVLLSEADRRLNLGERLAGCIVDEREITRSRRTRDRLAISEACMPEAKYCSSRLPLRLSKGSTATEYGRAAGAGASSSTT